MLNLVHFPALASLLPGHDRILIIEQRDLLHGASHGCLGVLLEDAEQVVFQAWACSFRQLSGKQLLTETSVPIQLLCLHA